MIVTYIHLSHVCYITYLTMTYVVNQRKVYFLIKSINIGKHVVNVRTVVIVCVRRNGWHSRIIYVSFYQSNTIIGIPSGARTIFRYDEIYNVCAFVEVRNVPTPKLVYYFSQKNHDIYNCRYYRF